MCVEVNGGDLEICDGVHSEAGFSAENFSVKRNQIATFPKTFGDTLTPAELAAGTALITAPVLAALSAQEKKGTLAGNIQLKTGMKFSKFPAMADTGDLNGSLVKEGSTSMKTTYGFECENTLQNRETLNEFVSGVIVFKSNEGIQMVLGSLEHPCKKTKQDEKHGRSSNGERMIALEFYCAKPARAYYGSVPVIPVP